MAGKKGQLVFGTLVTPAASKFPIVDANDVSGGRHFVDSITERNNIPASHRKAGMVVYVGGTVKKDYILKAGAPTTGNTTDDNWEEYAPGVPSDVLTEHQKVEQITYQTPYAPGKNTLLQKLEDLENAINGKLSDHQAAEDITYSNPTASGFNTLVEKLQDMDSKIEDASGDVYIENVTWQNTPSDLHQHKANLGEELESIWTIMNDPTKIMVIDGATSSKVTLQNKIAALEGKVPYANEISLSASDPTKISSYLTNSSNAINTIKYSTTQTLKEKIDAIASAAGSQTIENISWGSVPSGDNRNSSLSTELNTLFTTIADMNDPTKITIPSTILGTADDKNLNETITELKSLITAAAGVPTVELINWNTPRTGTGRNQELSQEIDYIFGRLNELANSNYITVPATVTGDTDKSLSDVISALQDLIDANTTAIGDANSGLTKDVADLKTAVGDADSGLTKDVADVKTAIGDENGGLTKDVADVKDAIGDADSGLTKDVADLKTTVGDSASGLVQEVNKLKSVVGNSSSGVVKDLMDAKEAIGDADSGLTKDVNDLKTAAEDYAKKDASNITVASNADGSQTDNLNTVIRNMLTSLNGIVIPQILLFNTSYPAVGALTSQEFLTNQKVKVKDIAIYTNVDATVAADISAKLEYCASGNNAYVDLDSNTAITLTAGTTQNSVDLTSSNIVVNAASRLRLNITAFDSSNVVDVLNVRVILEPTD